MARFADFDAALAAQEPLTLVCFGQTWCIGNVPFRQLARIGQLQSSTLDETEQLDVLIDVLGHLVGDPKRWVKAAEDADLRLLMGLVSWITEEIVGSPLVPLSASSPPSSANGHSPVGSSPELVSSIP